MQDKKPINEFGKRTGMAGGRCAWCLKCMRLAHKRTYASSASRRLQIRKNNIIRKNKYRQFIYNYLLQHPCVDCGEPDPVVLEFDHVRGIKRGHISQLVNNSFSIKTIQKEIKKCEVRCANCHRRKTHKTLWNACVVSAATTPVS